MEKINIILADDHKMFAEGVRFILRQEPDMNLLGEAGDGEETLELLQRNPHTHLLILDLEMPKMNGIEVMRKIRKDYPNLRTLILTYHNEGEYIYNLYRMGANGYVIKNSGGDALLHAIRDVMNKNRPFPPMPDWDPDGPDWNLLEEEVHLTCRERDVLMLADLSGQEIADELRIGKTSIDTHLSNLRKKFKAGSTIQMLRKAIRLGYVEA